jgi:hypothetical protein
VLQTHAAHALQYTQTRTQSPLQHKLRKREVLNI